MRTAILATLAVIAMAGTAIAAPEVTFEGALKVTSTSGCESGWNPNGRIFISTLWAPVPGSSNGNRSALALHSNSIGAEIYETDGAFSKTFSPVRAQHIFTLGGTYNAKLRLTSQTPTRLSLSTQEVAIVGDISGFDFRSGCSIAFRSTLYRRID